MAKYGKKMGSGMPMHKGMGNQGMMKMPAGKGKCAYAPKRLVMNSLKK